MKLGVCYYPEHWPEARWPIDAQMMRDAGLDVVRIAEFAWANMEPEPGHYTWEWLDRAIGVLAEAGLQVILGTPTATPPAWLTQAHPDVLRVERNGRSRQHGSRRHACPTSPTYRAHSRAIVTAMAERYGQDARVVGWQIDNEFGGGKTARCYCAACADAFRRWLQARYGSLAALNAAWGAVFWSQTYSAWEQVMLPDDAIDKPNPSQELDYFRFSSDAFVAYQQEQVDILRALAPGRFITHNFMGLYRDLNQFDLAEPLDFVSWDSYPTGNPDRWRKLLYPFGADAGRNDPVYAYDVGDPLITSMAHALTRGLKQRPFWIMEQQCGLINWGDLNPGVRPGTPRLWTWHALAEGAEACVYFRWRPSPYAQEQYHSGLLRHDGAPTIGLAEVRALAAARARMAAIAATPFTAEIGLLFDFDDLWAIQLEPHRRGFDYLRHLFVYYQALMRLGLPVDLVPLRADLSRYKLLIAPSLHIADDERAARLHAYAAQGGALLLGVRSGFKTGSNLVPQEPLPGALRELVGAQVTQWQSLPDGVEIGLESAVPSLNTPATIWVEYLQPETARVLARTASGHAVWTENGVGDGRCHFLGWYPTPDQARALLLHLIETSAVPFDRPPLPDLPQGLLAYRRGPYTLLLNFTDRALAAQVMGASLTVSPRDLVVLDG
jgi:beta-galactosidase